MADIFVADCLVGSTTSLLTPGDYRLPHSTVQGGLQLRRRLPRQFDHFVFVLVAGPLPVRLHVRHIGSITPFFLCSSPVVCRSDCMFITSVGLLNLLLWFFLSLVVRGLICCFCFLSFVVHGYHWWFMGG